LLAIASNRWLSGGFMSDLKERIKKELEYNFAGSGEIIGFFSVMISKNKIDKPTGTVTWICDEATREQGDLISKKLNELLDVIIPIFSR